jgi:hypothetical protein
MQPRDVFRAPTTQLVEHGAAPELGERDEAEVNQLGVAAEFRREVATGPTHGHAVITIAKVALAVHAVRNDRSEPSQFARKPGHFGTS